MPRKSKYFIRSKKKYYEKISPQKLFFKNKNLKSKKKKLKKFYHKQKSKPYVLSKLKCLFLFFIILFIFKYIKQYKNIIVIFAGRKTYIEILMRYLMNLKNNGKIHEIHFWQYTNEKKDTIYLDTLSNVHKTNGKFYEYREIYPSINNNHFIISIKSGKGEASILINEKYEINFQFNYDNTNNIKISILISGNELVNGIQNTNKIINNKFVKYIIKIINKSIIIIGKNNFEIKHQIDCDNFNSIKIRSTTETIWEYNEAKNSGIKLYDTVTRGKCYWYEMFEFYLDYDFNILIKADDDILFIDINRFDEYINFINKFKKNVTIPNLVNHAVSLFYNNKDGLVPNELLKPKYQNRNSSLDIFSYYADGDQAWKIHNYFLENMNKFLKNDLKPRSLTGEKPSICMFGVKKESYNYIYNRSIAKPKGYYFLDEIYTYSLYNNYIYPRLVSVHYSFGPQKFNSFVEHYRNLSIEINKNKPFSFLKRFFSRFYKYLF